MVSAILPLQLVEKHHELIGAPTGHISLFLFSGLGLPAEVKVSRWYLVCYRCTELRGNKSNIRGALSKMFVFADATQLYLRVMRVNCCFNCVCVVALMPDICYRSLTLEVWCQKIDLENWCWSLMPEVFLWALIPKFWCLILRREGCTVKQSSTQADSTNPKTPFRDNRY